MNRYCSLFLFCWFLPLAVRPQSASVPINKNFNTAAVTMISAGPLVIDSLKRELVNAKADTMRMWLFMHLSNTYRVQNLDSSRLYAQKAVALAQVLRHQEGELYTGLALAAALSEQDIPQSMRIYLALLSQAQNVSNYNVVFRCYFSIGLLHNYLRNFRQAIDNYCRARHYEQYVDTKGLVAANIDEFANEYLWLNQPDSARYYLSLSMRYYPAIRRNGTWLIFMGRLTQLTDLGLASHYFRESIQRYSAQGNRRGVSLADYWYSQLLWKQNQRDASIQVAKHGLGAGQYVNNYRAIFLNSTSLTNYYHLLGLVDSAYHYQRIMVAARDSLFSQEKINQLQTTLIEEQQRIQLLQQEKSQFESNVKIYGLLGLVVGLLLIAGILYRNDHQKHQANQLLNEQKAKVETALETLRTTQTQLIQREKMASLGELTAGIAHEIQNPLNFVNNFAEVSVELAEELEQSVQTDNKATALELATDLRQNMHHIAQNGQRASNIVRGMLEHARSSTGERLPTDLNALCDEYLRLAYQGVRAKQSEFVCQLETHFDPNLPLVSVVASDISRVLLNLFNNAFYAVGQKQKTAPTDYQPTVWVGTISQNGQVEIRVRDNGTGIPDAIKEKIFQPFFTTKPTGEGTGLGLSLSYDIVTKGHGGALRVDSHPNEYTEFSINLPFT